MRGYRRRLSSISTLMAGAVARLLRSHGYHPVFNRVIDGVEVDVYAVKATRRGYRGLIVEMKVLYRESLVRQVELRRNLAHRVYVALPDWSVPEALAELPEWTGVIAYSPVEDRADIVRKAVPQHTLLASLVSAAIGVELGLEPPRPRNPKAITRDAGGRSGRVKRP